MDLKFSLQNKVAIITGGGSGIGKAISKTFAKQACEVLILDLNMEAAEATVTEITDAGFKATAFKCDVSNQNNINDTIHTIAKTKTIDILINNLYCPYRKHRRGKRTRLDLIYNINIKGVYNCTKAMIPEMKKNGGGIIINMASIAASIAVTTICL